MTNPLLDWDLFPDFAAITPAHVEPAIRQVLADSEAALAALERSELSEAEALIRPLERLRDRLERVWGVVGHLHNVRNSPELREVFGRMQAEVVRFSNRLGQSQPLYDACCRLMDGPAFARLDRARQRLIESLRREAEHSGVGLTGSARERFNRIAERLAELGTQVQNRVLDATKAVRHLVVDRSTVAGLPAPILTAAARAAVADGHKDATADHGPWVLTIDPPTYTAVMQHGRDRSLRELIYRAHATRAASGPQDTTPLISEILTLRQEMADLLGHPTYAALSLSRKMAGTVAAAEALEERLLAAARPVAERELAELTALAKRAGAPEADVLQSWDVAFWAERLREERFDLNEESLRPYFPLPQVLDGLFALIQRLFGVRLVPLAGVPVWHPDVRAFAVLDGQGTRLAACYLDPYSRPADKRGGAWMDELVARSDRLGPGGTARPPVAYVNCNQLPPDGDRPSLMTFREVETLFHEFGHALQHLLTTVDLSLVAGIRNIEWDAVELASQFLENWCFDPATLAGLARHVDSGEPLAEAVRTRLLAARSFQQGLATLRQLCFGMLDLELHHRLPLGASQTPLDVQRRICQRTLLVQPVPEARLLNSFTHLFGGGYAAGYYSYKWSEVLSADAFAAFTEAGLADEATVQRLGRRYRDTVLALGGSEHPAEVFRRFRGRDPAVEPLLRQCGFVAGRE